MDKCRECGNPTSNPMFCTEECKANYLNYLNQDGGSKK